MEAHAFMSRLPTLQFTESQDAIPVTPSGKRAVYPMMLKVQTICTQEPRSQCYHDIPKFSSLFVNL